MELGRVLWEARTCSRQNRYNTVAYTLLLVSGQSIRSTIQPDTALQVIEQVKYQSHGGRPLSSNRPSVSATWSFCNRRPKDLRRPMESPELFEYNLVQVKIDCAFAPPMPHRARPLLSQLAAHHNLDLEKRRLKLRHRDERRRPSIDGHLDALHDD
jgi:hypothetical protein